MEGDVQHVREFGLSETQQPALELSNVEVIYPNTEVSFEKTCKMHNFTIRVSTVCTNNCKFLSITETI